MNPEEKQKVLKWVRVALIVLAVFLAVKTIGALEDLRSIDPTYNSISVSGVGEAVSIPDVATFSFTVSADAKVVSDAQSQVTKKMDAILAALKSLGIEEKDIKTIDYSVNPKYVFEPIVCITTPCPYNNRRVQDGYTVNHNVLVKVRNTKDSGQALAIAGENGATSLSGISFTIDDPDKIMDEARAEAILDAREKAKMLAKELDVRLVRVVSFYDNTGGGIPYFGEAMGGDMVKNVAPVPTIPVGENKITVSVTVTYEIR